MNTVVNGTKTTSKIQEYKDQNHFLKNILTNPYQSYVSAECLTPD